jgi:hypothetical protein
MAIPLIHRQGRLIHRYTGQVVAPHPGWLDFDTFRRHNPARRTRQGPVIP